VSNSRSYIVMTLSWCGANFGGATMTHAPDTAGAELSACSVIVAVAGPSDTSPYQSSLAQNVLSPEPGGDADVPNPPSTEQVTFRIAADSSERNRGGRKARKRNRACVEALRLVRTADRARAGIDGQIGGRFGVAAAGIRGFLVDEMDAPRDVRLGVRDFVERPIVVMRVNAKPRRLSLHAALGVL
jgi:hypothetical protein